MHLRKLVWEISFSEFVVKAWRHSGGKNAIGDDQLKIMTKADRLIMIHEWLQKNLIYPENERKNLRQEEEEGLPVTNTIAYMCSLEACNQSNLDWKKGPW